MKPHATIKNCLRNVECEVATDFADSLGTFYLGKLKVRFVSIGLLLLNATSKRKGFSVFF
jgi:hypothetical protein